MPDGGQREVDLTADHNAEMIEQIARYPRVRDRALFVGNHADIVADAFRPELPLIRDWTQAHFDFTGYITGFDPDELADRESRSCGSGLFTRRAGLHRDRRRVRRRLRPAAPGYHSLPRGAPARPQPADGRRHWSPHRPGGARSSTSPSATTSSRTSTSRTGSADTARDAAWTTRRRRRPSSPDAIAAEIGRAVTYQPVETDGAARAAALIAELL